MKREHLSLTVALPEANDRDRPTLAIEYQGSTASLADRLRSVTGSSTEDIDVDVAFRLIDEEVGVLSIADRYTGAFVLELDVETEAIKDVVAAAEDDDDRYRIELAAADEGWSFEKRTLLVYDADGQLLRSCSLIPGSVEL